MVFKKGMIVREKGVGKSLYIVHSVSGMSEYDKCGFISADQGFVIRAVGSADIFWARYVNYMLYCNDEDGI